MNEHLKVFVQAVGKLNAYENGDLDDQILIAMYALEKVSELYDTPYRWSSPAALAELMDSTPVDVEAAMYRLADRGLVKMPAKPTGGYL